MLPQKGGSRPAAPRPQEAAGLPKRLAGAAAPATKGWLHATLTVGVPRADGFGLFGSGMFIVNPPFTLHERLTQALPLLVELLGQHDGARYTLERGGTTG